MRREKGEKLADEPFGHLNSTCTTRFGKMFLPQYLLPTAIGSQAARESCNQKVVHLQFFIFFKGRQRNLIH